jgi:phosphate transport system substrate-binding protein
MKHLIISAIFALSPSVLGMPSASADETVLKVQGSDTLAGAMTDAIIASGLEHELSYIGGGSALGETALLKGQQGLAPMSREFTADALAQAAKQNVKIAPYVVGLDGVALFVNSANAVQGLDFATLIDIFSCKTTRWEQVQGSGKVGVIRVLRRNDQSGTTDTFKKLVGLKDFGACATVVAETSDVASATSTDALAIGYAGLSAKRDGNREVAISKAGSEFVAPTVATIRSFKYPLARKLFIYSVSGARKPSSAEQRLLNNLTDRSFMDPIIQNNEFFTVD